MTNLGLALIAFSALLTACGSHPGAHFRCSSPQVHHGFMRITWILLRGDGAESWRGMDFGELAPDGRIRRITGFFGAPPSVAP